MKHFFKWNYFRISIVLMAGLHGIVSSHNYQQNDFVGIIQLVVVFLFTPIALIFVIGLQSVNKRTAEKWETPSWFLNPFDLKQPLQLFHFAAFIFIANGFGSLINFLWLDREHLIQSFFPLMIGGGLLIGTHLCLFIFKKKIKQ